EVLEEVREEVLEEVLEEEKVQEEEEEAEEEKPLLHEEGSEEGAEEEEEGGAEAEEEAAGQLHHQCPRGRTPAGAGTGTGECTEGGVSRTSGRLREWRRRLCGGTISRGPAWRRTPWVPSRRWFCCLVPCRRSPSSTHPPPSSFPPPQPLAHPRTRLHGAAGDPATFRHREVPTRGGGSPEQASGTASQPQGVACNGVSSAGAG
ncbi:hypothetical protein T484DRAFT_1890013, partial [Baffinella frigidus]